MAPLLPHRAVLITISKLDEGEQLVVNVCPRQISSGENPALTTPLCVTGTAAELDAELVQQIATFVESHVGLNTNLAAIQAEIAEAERSAREDAAKRKQKVVGNGGKKATPVEGEKPDVAKPKAQPPQSMGLFDQVDALAAPASEQVDSTEAPSAPANTAADAN
ncbi:MAG: PRTRC system protein E [Bryobacterales bacterium]|nr:PRTRC system protein E [Bryobacterales bacterium]